MTRLRERARLLLFLSFLESHDSRLRQSKQISNHHSIIKVLPAKCDRFTWTATSTQHEFNIVRIERVIAIASEPCDDCLNFLNGEGFGGGVLPGLMPLQIFFQGFLSSRFSSIAQSQQADTKVTLSFSVFALMGRLVFGRIRSDNHCRN